MQSIEFTPEETELLLDVLHNVNLTPHNVEKVNSLINKLEESIINHEEEQ